MLWILSFVVAWLNVCVSKATNTTTTSPTITLYSYDAKDKSLANSLVGNNFVAPTKDLPMIPKAFSNLAQLLSYPMVTPTDIKTHRPPIKMGRPPMVGNGLNPLPGGQPTNDMPQAKHNHRQIQLSPIEREQLQLAQMTDTDLACYIAPPDNTIVDMDLVRFNLIIFLLLIKQIFKYIAYGILVYGQKNK